MHCFMTKSMTYTTRSPSATVEISGRNKFSDDWSDSLSIHYLLIDQTETKNYSEKEVRIYIYKWKLTVNDKAIVPETSPPLWTWNWRYLFNRWLTWYDVTLKYESHHVNDNKNFISNGKVHFLIIFTITKNLF